MTDWLERLQPLLIWTAAALLAVVVGWWSLTHLRIPVGIPWRAFPDQLWLDGLARWDSFWYRSIADVGYGYSHGLQSNFAFFPGYPLAMWAFGSLVGDLFLGGIVASSILAVVSLYLFRAWIRQTVPGQGAVGPMVALMFAPGAFILAGVAYSESLYLASAIAAFLLLERERPFMASLAALPALATRPVGFALVIGLIIRSLELHVAPSSQDRIEKLKAWIRGSARWIALAGLGLGAYPVYLWITVGDPLIFLTAGAEGWGHGLDLGTVLKTGPYLSNPYPEFGAVIGLHTVVLLSTLVVIPSVRRTFGLGYAVFAAIVILLPTLVRPTLIGVSRYALAAFPVWASIALNLNRDLPRVRWLVLAASIATFVFLFSLFARWYFVV